MQKSVEDVRPGSRALSKIYVWVDEFGFCDAGLNLHLRFGGHHLVRVGHGGGTDVDNLAHR